MTERFIKMVVFTTCMVFALGFSEILSAATATGALTISVVVLSRCVMKFVTGGVAPQSVCDDGTTATLTTQPATKSSNIATPSSEAQNDGKSVITLTY